MSATQLAEACEAYGAAQEPPISSTLTKARIYGLENSLKTGLKIDEAYLLAGVFGVSLEAIITNSPQESAAEKPDAGMVGTELHSNLSARVDVLETQMGKVADALSALGVTSFLTPNDQKAQHAS